MAGLRGQQARPGFWRVTVQAALVVMVFADWKHLLLKLSPCLLHVNTLSSDKEEEASMNETVTGSLRLGGPRGEL